MDKDEQVAKIDAVYAERNLCVALAAYCARLLGWRVGLGKHGDDPWANDWRSVVYVDSPLGQLSWHIHDSEKPLFEHFGVYDAEYDGSPAAEKYDRVRALVAGGRRQISDDFGGTWMACADPRCDLEIVRPGKVQCSGYCDGTAPTSEAQRRAQDWLEQTRPIGDNVIVTDLLAELRERSAENERLKAMAQGGWGHDARCYYCAEPCNALAGNPGLWPIPLAHEDEPGVVKAHHIACVSTRLHARDTYATCLRDIRTYARTRMGVAPGGAVGATSPTIVDDDGRDTGVPDPLIAAFQRGVNVLIRPKDLLQLLPPELADND